MANKIVKLKDGSDYLYPYADMCGMDKSNQIASGTLSQNQTYTATQDCFAYVGVLTNSANYSMAYARINDLEVGYANENSTLRIDDIFFLKNGQTLKCVYQSAASLTYKIYGLKY